ncbi:hypothetical protein [Aeromonas media]|uniref:hypothetical protein n=1 Tax=Aeromonas media TaxID=651 RepID=UPI003D23E50E
MTIMKKTELEQLRAFSNKLSIKERKSFVSGFNLPVPVILDGGIFFHQICTIDPIYRSLEKLKMLMALYEAGDTYGNAKSHAIQSAIQDVKSAPGFNEFNRKAFDGQLKKSLGRKNTLYDKEHIGRSFISVDMINACFQAIKFAKPKLVFECDDYPEFISKYTEHDVLRKSKTIAHLIFSGLNSNLQQEIQFHIMCTILEHLDKEGVRDNMVAQFTSDELVIYNEPGVYEKVKNALFNTCKDLGLEMNKVFRTDLFVLKGFGAEVVGTCFVKCDLDNKAVAMKGIESKYMPEAMCFVQGRTPDRKDRMMDFDGRIAAFDMPIKFEWISNPALSHDGEHHKRTLNRRQGKLVVTEPGL